MLIPPKDNQSIPCLIIKPEPASYNEILKLQKTLWSAVVAGNPKCRSALVVVEHNPVITMGTATLETSLPPDKKLLEDLGIELVDIDRGGDATYHGPGQIVAYPIVDVRKTAGDIHSFLRLLENAVIDTIAEYGLSGVRHGLAGVWVDNQKVCSIGIAVRKWVSYHGLALNVAPNLNHFSLIRPCGLDPTQITSMERLLGHSIDFDEVKEKLITHICRELGLEPIFTESASSALSAYCSGPGSDNRQVA